jgi:hypothetical protein
MSLTLSGLLVAVPASEPVPNDLPFVTGPEVLGPAAAA